MTFYTVLGQQIHVKEEGVHNSRNRSARSSVLDKLGDPHQHTDHHKESRLALLIHGWSSSWYAMSPLMPVFRRYHCIAVDLPGYGDSPPSPGPETIEHYADLMAALIKQISPGQSAVVIGHSMGGMITLTLALKYPDLVERMVLLCPTVTGRLSLFMNLFVSPAVLVERYVASGISKLLQPYLLGVTDRLMRPASLSEGGKITQEQYERIRADARRPGQNRVRAECFWAMREGDLRGKLDAIREIPTLAIWGMEDNTVPLRDASVLAAVDWQELDLRILPLVSHWPQFEASDTTRRFIKAFLGKPLKLIQALTFAT